MKTLLILCSLLAPSINQAHAFRCDADGTTIENELNIQCDEGFKATPQQCENSKGTVLVFCKPDSGPARSIIVPCDCSAQ